MRAIASILMMLALSIPGAQGSAETADIVFKNGNVYTDNDRQPRA